VEPAPLNIAMIDPSRMTPGYDASLCASLTSAGHNVTLHIRDARDYEPTMALQTRGLRFYPASEWLRRRVTARVGQVAKIVEHSFDLTRLFRRLRRDRPDVIHLQWSVVPVIDFVFVKLAIRFIAPLIMTIHDTNPLHGVSRLSAQRLGIRSCIRAASGLVVHTRFSLEDLAPNDGTEVAVIPLAVDPVPRALPPKDGTFRVLMFGRVRHYKGVDILIDSLTHLRPDTRERTVVLIAGSPLMDVAPLKAQAAALGLDDLINWRLEFQDDEETHAAFAEADVLALPYRDVDGSGVLSQAFGYGTPVVAANLGGFREQLEHERTALLFTPEDPVELARALQRIADDSALAQRLRDTLLEAGESMTWSHSAESNVGLYRRTLIKSAQR